MAGAHEQYPGRVYADAYSKSATVEWLRLHLAHNFLQIIKGKEKEQLVTKRQAQLVSHCITFHEKEHSALAGWILRFIAFRSEKGETLIEILHNRPCFQQAGFQLQQQPSCGAEN
jgi:hypothetical protein